MNTRSVVCAVAVAGLMGLAGSPAMAGDTGGNTNSKTLSHASRQAGVPDESGVMNDTWARDYAAQHNGRISRDAYLQEMGRRWDTMDQGRQGLTPAQVSQLTGHVDSNAAPALTGSGVQAGNMGPGNARGQ